MAPIQWRLYYGTYVMTPLLWHLFFVSSCYAMVAICQLCYDSYAMAAMANISFY